MEFGSGNQNSPCRVILYFSRLLAIIAIFHIIEAEARPFEEIQDFILLPCTSLDRIIQIEMPWLVLMGICAAKCYLHAAFTNPGLLLNFDCPTEIDELRDIEEQEDIPEIPYCGSCKKVKVWYSHHCVVCQACVIRMDHHCRKFYHFNLSLDYKLRWILQS